MFYYLGKYEAPKMPWLQICGSMLAIKLYSYEEQISIHDFNHPDTLIFLYQRKNSLRDGIVVEWTLAGFK
jgi:hypothetical protein